MSKSQTITLEYHEEIRGYYSAFDPDAVHKGSQEQIYRDSSEQGQFLKNKIKCLFRILIRDVDDFISSGCGTAIVKGAIDSPRLGGRLKIEQGLMELIFKEDKEGSPSGKSRVQYHILVKNSEGRKLFLSGYKKFFRGPENVRWQDISTLYFDIFDPENKDIPLYKGVMDTDPDAFAKQMLTYRSSGPSRWLRSNAVCRFNEMMYRRYWDSYQSKLWESEPEMWEKHIIPCNTHEGVRGAKVEIHPINTKDGLGLTLTRFYKKKSKNVALLIHGLTTSTDMFIMPEHYNLVQYMLDHGFDDVWSLDWRGSRRFPYNLKVHRYTMDHVALYDIPAAVNGIRNITGEGVQIHAIAHCVGSIALMASVAAKRVSGLASMICNSVSLSPKVHTMSKLKIMLAPDVVEYLMRFNYISPEFPIYPLYTPGRWLSRLISLGHKECDEPSCHMLSFMWGWGSPAAYQHRNISPITHARLSDLFGGTSVHYYRHLRKMIFEGCAVPYISHRALPRNYLDAIATMTLPPTLFISGRENHIFPGSNLKTYSELRQLNPQAPIEYEEFRGYGHQDIFIGRAADRDIFPSLLRFLNRCKNSSNAHSEKDEVVETAS